MPPPITAMVNEGVEGLSGDPWGHRCLPRRAGRSVVGVGLTLRRGGERVKDRRDVGGATIRRPARGELERVATGEEGR